MLYARIRMCEQMPPRRTPPPPPLEQTTMDMVCKFCKLSPPKFEGGTNPFIVWGMAKEDAKPILCDKGLECFKVQQATYQFEKEAEYW